MASAMVQKNIRITPELNARLEAEMSKTQTTATAVVTKALDKFLPRG